MKMRKRAAGQTSSSRETDDVQDDGTQLSRRGWIYNPVIDLNKVPTKRRNSKRARIALDLNQTAERNEPNGQQASEPRNQVAGNLVCNVTVESSSERSLPADCHFTGRKSVDELGKFINQSFDDVNRYMQQLIPLACIGESMSMNQARGIRIRELEEQLVAEQKSKTDLQKELDLSKEICRRQDQTIRGHEEKMAKEMKMQNELTESNLSYHNELMKIKKMIYDGELLRIENPNLDQGGLPEAK